MVAWKATQAHKRTYAVAPAISTQATLVGSRSLRAHGTRPTQSGWNVSEETTHLLVLATAAKGLHLQTGRTHPVP